MLDKKLEIALLKKNNHSKVSFSLPLVENTGMIMFFMFIMKLDIMWKNKIMH